MRGLLPMAAPLQRALRVDQQVGDVLHIPHLLRAAAYLQQRVVRRRARVDGIEVEAVREARAPAGRELPVLALDVVHHHRVRPGQERSEEHTSELQSLMRISYAVFCLKQKTSKQHKTNHSNQS